MAHEQACTRCPRFSGHERICVKLTERINAARTAPEKAAAATELMEAVQELLECQQHQERCPDCQFCGNVARLRKRKAELVLKVAAISRW